MPAPAKARWRNSKSLLLAWAALALLCLVYFYRLDAAGVLGPDEPRYASIGREMARSGDWITPRLWGQAWFEKPALLYWMTGAAFRLGLGPDLAPRLPVALCSVAFLVFFWWLLRREFGGSVAWLAALILATSAEWIGFSQVGVTDLPMAAAFTAALLLALPWVERGETRGLIGAGALLGVAVLAKGLVPLALAAPLVWPAWKHRRSLPLALPRIAVPLLAVCLPWYGLCYLRNGPAFLTDFFLKHHFGRFASDALQHREPWWFYLPVLAGALLPWTPLIFATIRRGFYRDTRRLFLLLVVLWGLLLFSASVNKLPGYVLPLVPACAILMALGVEEPVRARGPAVSSSIPFQPVRAKENSPGREPWETSPPGEPRNEAEEIPARNRRIPALLALCGLLLVSFPIAGAVLPGALLAGLSRTPLPAFHWIWLAPLPVAAAAWILVRRQRRLAAVACVACGAALGVLYLKRDVMPEVDRVASARPLWLRISAQADRTCVEPIQRSWRYGLNYYSVAPLPDCPAAGRPVHVIQAPGRPPEAETR
ncbi:MAG: glycosyltransferase family 39 protein [Bryobacteraceae bacterium]|jgi:4-amino-4-deoxy-L-arabinose transferase-like glycosyltransferase